MSLKKEIYQTVLNLYGGDYFPSNIIVKWFVTKYDEKDILMGIDGGGRILVIYKEKEVEKALHVIDNIEIDYSIMPEYVVVGDNIGFADNYLVSNEIDFKIVRKKPDSDYQAPTKKDLEVALFAVKMLNDTYKKYRNKIEEENEDYFHYLSYKDDNIKMNRKKLKREYVYVLPKTNLQGIIFNPQNIIEGVSTLSILNISVPVFSHKRNKIVNPYLLHFKFGDNNKNFFYLLDVEQNDLTRETINILNSIDTLSDTLFVESTIVIRDLSKLITNKIHIIPSITPAETYFDLCHFIGVILEDNEDFLQENGYIDIDDLNEAIKNIGNLKRYLYDHFHTEVVDDLLLKTSSAQYYEQYEHYYFNNSKYENYSALVFFYFAFQQFYYYEDSSTEEEDPVITDLDEMVA